MSEQTSIIALEEIRQDKKKLEDAITLLGQEFEAKYPGFEIYCLGVNRYLGVRGCKTGKFHCELQIKIPWL